MKVKVTKDGPYQVTENTPIKEEIITPVGDHNEYRPGAAVKPDKAEEYYLCRCGHSKHAPFCDGTHAKIGFDGTEVADRRPYVERVKKGAQAGGRDGAAGIVEGTTMRLLDDGRCAFARFCDRDGSEVWTLTSQDADPEKREQAIVGAANCPAGRLVEVAKDGSHKPLESELPGEVVILQDPAEGTSAGIAVRGPVQLIAADGTAYEQRNRVALCRCGASGNKPFCDASHIGVKYHDGRGEA